MQRFEGFEYKKIDFSAFIDNQETLSIIDGEITSTGSVADFNDEWNKDLEELNNLLNEAFKELSENSSN